MEINEEELLKLGFTEKHYKDWEDGYVEYLIGKKAGIQLITYDDFIIRLMVGDECEDVPNCKTVEDLKSLIRILNIQ